MCAMSSLCHSSLRDGTRVVQIASLLALILAWVYIFDTVMKERELLENLQEGIVGAIPRDVESQAPGTLPQQNQNGRSGAHTAHLSMVKDCRAPEDAAVKAVPKCFTLHAGVPT